LPESAPHGDNDSLAILRLGRLLIRPKRVLNSQKHIAKLLTQCPGTSTLQLKPQALHAGPQCEEHIQKQPCLGK
jgi:hypothetical protein